MNLRVLQLGDSALPIGGYSHSWGLEAAIDRALVRDATSLEAWVRQWLRFALAPFEGVIVAAVCRAGAKQEWLVAVRANEILWAGLTPPTLRNASRDMGEQLLALAEQWSWAADSAAAIRQEASDRTEWHHAPVFGTLAAACDSQPEEALAVYLHQAALGAIGAGVRTIPIGHTHGQQVLARLHDDISVLAAKYADADLETAGSFCPNYEMFCDAQSRLYTRLFRS